MNIRRTNVRFERVSREHRGRRIDNYLAQRMKSAPKSLIYKLLRSGQVRVNGGRIKPNYRLVLDDEIRIPPIEVRSTSNVVVSSGMIDKFEKAILLEDEHFLIINKPAKVASHTGTGVEYGVVDIVRQMRPNAPRIDLAHRLDKDTSGCIVLSKHLEALHEFHDTVRNRKCAKYYRALVKGKLPQGVSSIEAPLEVRRLQNGRKRAIAGNRGKAAQTVIEGCRSIGPHSLLDLQLTTGRMHQIRAHAQYVGHPVAGDERYGAPEFNISMRSIGLNRLFLHASHIEYRAFNKDFSVTAELPDLLEDVMRVLGSKKSVLC